MYIIQSIIDTATFVAARSSSFSQPSRDVKASAVLLMPPEGRAALQPTNDHAHRTTARIIDRESYIYEQMEHY